MVVIETKLDQQTITKANRKVILRTLPFFMLIGLLFVFIGLFLKTDNYENWYILVIFGVSFAVIMSITVLFAPKKSAKSSRVFSDETIQTTTFDEYKVIFDTVKGEDFKSHMEANYSYFMQAIETKDYFLLYPSNGQFHVVDKNAKILEGSIEELRNYLKLNLGNKFKSKF